MTPHDCHGSDAACRGDAAVVDRMPAGGTTSAAVYDPALALHRAGGDRALRTEVARLFLEVAPKWLAEIGAAIERRDASGLERAAHRVKGAAGSLAALATCEAALRLEMHGRAGQMEKAAESRLALEREIERLRVALGALNEGEAA